MRDYYCQEKNSTDVWRCYKVKAIADIQSELVITAEEAENRLEASNIDNPVELKEVSYWVEIK